MVSAAIVWFLVAAGGDAQPGRVAIDPRHVQHGLVIPDEGYCDQPYVVVTKNGAWLCVLTTGKGKEGDRGQHVVSTISLDRGATWSKPLDIEPDDGPEASWATPYIAPSGRVFVFYDYNGDEVRTLKRKTIRADMLGWYCFRYSDDHGASWSTTRHRIPLRVTACDRSNDWNGSVQIFWGISKPIERRGSMLLTFTKLGKYMLDQGEGWILASDNIATESDPEQIDWRLLPDGEHGLRHPRFGSVQEEHNIVPLSDGSLFCVYRTTTGHPCQCVSQDGGRTWSTPGFATERPGGRPIKHPRACPKIWRTQQGKYLLWHHHHAGKDFQGRNPAWIVGGVERQGRLHWSQPEILLYDDDPRARMSYPDLIEQDGRYWITETQKTIARVHEVDASLLASLWEQCEDQANGKRAARGIELTDGAPDHRPVKIPPWPALKANQGFSIELEFDPGPSAPTILFDSRDPTGRGVWLELRESESLALNFHDGANGFTWVSDPGGITKNARHHVVLTVDGGPRIVTVVVDGEVEDGGTSRPSGWGRIDARLALIPSSRQAMVRAPERGTLWALRLYSRPLRHHESVLAARYFRTQPPKKNPLHPIPNE